MAQLKPVCTTAEAYRTARVVVGTTMMNNALIYKGGVHGGGPPPVAVGEVKESVHSGPRPIGESAAAQNVQNFGQAPNPFRARTLARQLRSGPHKPSTVLDDRIVMRDEIVVAMQREAHQLHDQPFPPSPF